MTNADRILETLRSSAEPLDDDELSRRCGIYPRQQVNQICRRLAAQGTLTRLTGQHGKMVNALADRAGPGAPVAPKSEILLLEERSLAPPTPRTFSRREWGEAAVQAAIVSHLEATGWEILRAANTSSKEHGVDIEATRGAESLLVEVKGWPGTTYSSGAKAGQVKPTQPATQARHYFDGALTSSLARIEGSPTATPALGFPEKATYLNRVLGMATALGRLGVVVFWVSSNGSVREQHFGGES